MVTRERVLEKQLDDVRNLRIGLTLAILVSIPLAIFTGNVTVQNAPFILAWLTLLLYLLREVRKRYEELYRQYVRDPPMDDLCWKIGLAATLFGIVATIILMVLSLLS